MSSCTKAYQSDIQCGENPPHDEPVPAGQPLCPALVMLLKATMIHLFKTEGRLDMINLETFAKEIKPICIRG